MGQNKNYIQGIRSKVGFRIMSGNSKAQIWTLI